MGMSVQSVLTSLLAVLALWFVPGCRQAPAPSIRLGDLSPVQRKAVELAQAFLVKEGVDWGQPSRVAPAQTEYLPGMKGPGVYVVTYPTPPREVQLLGDRAVLVDIDTGRVAYLPRC